MRSSKNRSRSKNNRNRSVGNIVNRVFDSSGPEGKVRGTPQQIIEKYNQLARDAQLSNDRVAAENFQQHAEHYLRLLGEAQKDLEAQRVEKEQQQQERRERQDAERAERQRKRDEAAAAQESASSAGAGDQPDLVFVEDGTAKSDEADSGLVETPESAPKPKRSRPPRKPRRKPEAKSDTGSDAPQPDTSAPQAESGPADGGPAESGDTPEAAE